MPVVAVENLGRLFHHADDINMFCQGRNDSGHREPAVYQKILCTDTSRTYPFNHVYEMLGGLNRRFFSALMRTAAFIQSFLTGAQTLFRISRGEQ